jgi:hypothetical protein
MPLCSQGYVQNDFGLLQPVMACANINNAQRSERAVPSIYDRNGSVFGGWIPNLAVTEDEEGGKNAAA